MPYESKAQQGKLHALEAEGKVSHKVIAEYDKATKGHYGDLPMHKGAAHNEKHDYGNGAVDRQKSPEAGKYGKGQTPEKPLSRGPTKGGHEADGDHGGGKGGTVGKGSAYSVGKKVGGGDVSGNEHHGQSAVQSVEGRDPGRTSSRSEQALSAEDHQDGLVHDGPIEDPVGHVHHHEDIHIHLGSGIANEGAATSMMHQNRHSGFGPPPPRPDGVVPMYTASQQGTVLGNDSHPTGNDINAAAHSGTAAVQHVKRKSNPVRKGRG